MKNKVHSTKLKHYEKATKFEKNLPPVLTKQLFLLSSVKTSGIFFSNFCGLFRKPGLYRNSVPVVKNSKSISKNEKVQRHLSKMIMKKNQKYQEYTNSRDKLRHEIVRFNLVYFEPK